MDIDKITEKRCSKCKEIKSIKNFSKNKSMKDRHNNLCKMCCKTYGKEYRNNNKDKLSRCKKEYYENNKDKIIKHVKEHYKNNKDKILDRAKEYYRDNKDKIKEYNKEYRNNNKDKLIELGKKYREVNKDKINKCKKEQYENNKDKILEQVKKYRESNKDKIKEQRKNYFKEYYDSFYGFNNIYREQLKPYEEIRASDDNFIMVRCTYCGSWFKPRIKEIRIRLYALAETASGEGRFYCSDGCKKACPIFHKAKWPKGFKQATSREVQPQLRQMVLKRDGWACLVCDKTVDEVELHCHHITGVVQNPIESADMDNCITLCKKCHKRVHKEIGCRFVDLQCKKGLK